MHEMDTAFSFARFKAGSSMAARMAMMAMTTSNSINVKPACFGLLHVISCFMMFDPFSAHPSKSLPAGPRAYCRYAQPGILNLLFLQPSVVQ
jgi:hypothetical protein